MLDDKNLFKNNKLKELYGKFKENLQDAVSKGKIHEIDSINHVSNLVAMGQEKRHEDATKYLQEQNKKYGFTAKSDWKTPENWGK
jgi:hypothetical protein